jgi:hypothetical protein
MEVLFMLDSLYENIGGKIKNRAKWIFIVEAICTIIIGLVLLFTDEDLILYALLMLICGPIVAYVGSWILYAFGELVEDIHAIRNKEGTTEEAKIKHDIEMKAKQNTCGKNEVEEDNSPEAIKKRKTNAWDHWDEIDSSFGQCEICKKKGRYLLLVEYEDSDGKHQKKICYDCFCERDCRPVERSE